MAGLEGVKVDVFVGVAETFNCGRLIQVVNKFLAHVLSAAGHRVDVLKAFGHNF